MRLNKSLKYGFLASMLFSVCAFAFCYYTAIAQSGVPQKKRADASVHASAPDLIHTMPGTLFPGLNADSVTAVSIQTPENSFEFQRGKGGNVSINGRRGDNEVFLTLLEQIEEFPVDEQTAFSDENTPLLTLSILCSDRQYTARFYSGEHEGAPAHIICDAQGGRQYRRADAWRMGTLLMTCEGIRIQDESGNEFPAD